LVPFLGVDSPCIDAGNPASAYNDVEDPENPGFALWPSLGTLRNDIGFTGGPHAAMPDSNWVAVKKMVPATRPAGPHLSYPYPNPFNPVTQLCFDLDKAAYHAELKVYDLMGREVATLAQGPFSAGSHTVLFHASELASGVYFAMLKVDGVQLPAQKMLLVK
jgi:hypothetical protein